MAGTKLIIGDLAGIEDALASAVSSARAADPLALATVLAGHTLLRPYLRRALARRGVPLLNVQIVLPDELAERLAPAQSLDRPKLTRWAERLIVHEVASGARGYFAEIAGRDGFVRALGRLFRELDRGGFTPASFRDAAQSAAAALRPSQAKLDELVRLYANYVEDDGARASDGAPGARRRSAFLAPADRYAAVDAARFEGPLFVYGAWALPELHVRMIERIAVGADVTVFLPWYGGDADEAHEALRDRLAPDGAVGRLPAREATDPARLAHAIFREPAAALAEPSVALASAPDTVREVWEAARACLDWAQQGVRFHEMAVVYRNGDTYRELIDEIFRAAGVTTYVHEGRPLAAHPLGRRLLALLDLAADAKFTRGKVMEFLTETEIPLGSLPDGAHASPSEWEAFTREAGVIEGGEQFDARLKLLAEGRRARAADEERPWLVDQATRIDRFRAFIDGFARALTEHPAEATWKDHLAFLAKIASAYAKGTEKIVEALGDLEVLEQVRSPVTFDAFRRAVRDDLESRDLSAVFGEPLRLFGREGVAVLDATSVRHLRFRAVSLLGLAERAWPPPPRPDALLLERERRALNAAGGGALPMKTEPDEEQLTFLLATQSATEHLRLSYARSVAGSTGRHVPSYFFRAVVDALEGRRVPFAEIEESTHVQRLAAGRLAAGEAASAVSPSEYDRTLVHEYVNGRAGDEAVRALMRETPAFARAIEARSSRWSSALTPYDGVLSADDAVAAVRARSPFGRGESVSASRLEMYAECPYRYFLHYLLRVDPLEEPEMIERMDHLERGSLIHGILERFMREICPDDPPAPAARDRHIRRLLEIAREESRLAEERGVTGRQLIWRIDARQIEEDLVRWYGLEAADTSGLRPTGFEVGFGPQYHPSEHGEDPLSSAQPLALLDGERTVMLNGRIDRIDVDSARTRFRVIDYKTGKDSHGVTVKGGRMLQLPVYLQAGSRLLGIPAEHGTAQYFYMTSRGDYRRREINGDWLAARSDELVQILETIADGVDNGLFLPNPGKGNENCRYCDYKDVCDARIGRMMARKNDTRGAAYASMTEIE